MNDFAWYITGPYVDLATKCIQLGLDDDIAMGTRKWVHRNYPGIY